METRDEEINKILGKSKEYREQLTSNMNSFTNTEKEFSDFGDIFGKIFNVKDSDLEDKNNLFLKCLITNQEALNGCTKKIKYKHMCEDGKKRINIIDVKIPKGVQKGQSIVSYGDGNYIKELGKRSNVIIKIETK